MHHPGGYISYKMNKIVSHCYTEIGYFPDCFIEKIVLNFLKKEKKSLFYFNWTGAGEGALEKGDEDWNIEPGSDWPFSHNESKTYLGT